ncbi:hypothetical protein L207DRAFT_594031 [Hyaloscypha variabilis F]|uniref:histidine kinase n=1 Tax=Hyaloscypha variabilis (strain UAMH 11265 / GT02V1 / F) TaxID=1149755 RepID=A0A2J6QRD8_HYAVF|nr:hypothetical protein L207DRAFT_594031 [Hyaloscypha variabilis F]
MAPVEATMALSHQEGVTDSARARELYKYYQPNAPINADTCFPAPPPVPEDNDDSSRDLKVKSSVTSSKISSPDTALTAFCQLTTWRTGAQRAMISVIDAETQYFIAESTKSVDLVDNTRHDPGDDLWMGCGSVTKAGRLCEKTIAVAPTKAGDYPCFLVEDLSKDERFNTLRFVTGEPHLKFYAGVPLITKRGIPIGSLFVVDDRAGLPLNREQRHFMGTMAVTIMKHMEMAREVEEHRRGMKMSRGLASFVEGRAELAEADVEAEDNEGSRIAGQFEEPSITKTRSKGSTASAIGSAASIEHKEREYSAALSKTEEAIMESQDHTPQTEPASTRPEFGSLSQPNSFGATSISVYSPNDTQDRLSPAGEDASETSSMRLLFSRAANLIREAFEVDGGAVFYDAQTGFSSNARQQEPSSPFVQEDSQTDSLAESSHASGDDQASSGEQIREQDAKISSPSLLPQGSPPGLGETFSRTTKDSGKSVEILGFSTAEASSIHGDSLPGPQSFTPFEEKALHTLLRRYPRGKLWTFDIDGAVSSSSEDEAFKRLHRDLDQRRNDIRRRNVRNSKAKSDARFLAKHFPSVRQLLFVPLWDAGRSRWLSGCFAWSTEPTRILSKQSELAFLTAFGNSVMAEWARIDTETADQKKGDFIGSISHELRSPLHGILASAEFLEEVTTGWESRLVETIDSCGRTLLDTINHILDYSKINHFEKNWRKSKREGRRPNASRGGSLSLKQSDLPMLNLFQDVDISVICEEVVESVFAGHVFQNITAQSFDVVPDSRGKMSDPKNLLAAPDQLMGSGQAPHSGVAVILDVDLQNYHFTTQPGALRRLIMNLLGNALKYTSHGYVRIKLDATDMEDLPGTAGSQGTNDSVPRSRVTLTVTDTGKGISADFLRSKLFMPFAQENSLSSGTGLGLSIVRKIVSLLEGEITIDSEVGRGTQVRVTLPLLREMPRATDSSSSTTKSIMSIPRETDESIIELRRRLKGQKVVLHGFDIETKDPIVHEMGKLLKASITTFVVNWYGLKVVPIGQKASIIISNEGSPDKISALVERYAKIHRSTPSIVVLCSHSSRFDRSLSSSSQCNVGFVAKPVGPLKLAKAITQCLEGESGTITPGPDGPVTQPESTDLSNVFEELSMSPRGGEVLDNTRMAADSANARKAIESPTPNALAEKHAEFPFPPAMDTKPSMPKSLSMPADKTALSPVAESSAQPASLTLAAMEKVSLASDSKTARKKIPTLLLVDDNQINLRLLSTYLKRRNYEVVDEASDGLEAVKRFEGRGAQGYDVVFMDITMPVLDGFGATRQIRAIEESRQQKTESAVAGEQAEKGEKARNPALIIAFTGRSSIEDQTEALRVGIDLFMTKPVAFKEVGKIIDNWVANREREGRGSEE